MTKRPQVDSPDLVGMDLDWGFTAEYHLFRAKEDFKKANSFKQVIWVTLELRMALERLCFEYLVLLTYKKRDISKSELKLYSPKDIMNRVLKEQPYLHKMVDYGNAVFAVRGINHRMTRPDGQWLIKTHGKLGNYLHLQHDDFTDQNKIELIDFLKDALEVAIDFAMDRFNITVEREFAVAIFEDYVNDKIDKSQMETRIKLSYLPDNLYNPE